MPNLGPTELLIIGLILLLVFGAVVTVLVLLARRAAAPSSSPLSAPHLDLGPKGRPGPSDLQGQVRALLGQRKKIQAIKLVREQTGLGLAAAKKYVDDLEAGRFPEPPSSLSRHGLAHQGFPDRGEAPSAPSYHGADLATRVRDLKASGRVEQAVFLVRGETGMAESDAWRFVDSIG
ncbi:ribosomal protein L7/L12 [Streptosporangium carneum]|uniref:Large ribosomal subunit protein bL12 C-terminal domain-containing protein n=1 Tax=Streptosporangium carneum TaxID=47481 RepID=A0A9W6ICJ1_9ACTN|nr:ribosomal protein L7/L12 [Streptosporangium carneum]GLK15203.1 hypothetical protein GCM10017600_86160 [Streptosporangium carneum]